MQGTIDWLFNLGAHYPDIMSLALAGLIGFSLTIALERYVLPVVSDPLALRRQQGATFLFCWFVTGTAGALLWWAIDPVDALHVRLIVSYTTGCLSFFVYPALSRMLSAKFPAIGSAWSKTP